MVDFTENLHLPVFGLVASYEAGPAILIGRDYSVESVAGTPGI